jgi:hypothetical protein
MPAHPTKFHGQIGHVGIMVVMSSKTTPTLELQLESWSCAPSPSGFGNDVGGMVSFDDDLTAYQAGAPGYAIACRIPV